MPATLCAREHEVARERGQKHQVWFAMVRRTRLPRPAAAASLLLLLQLAPASADLTLQESAECRAHLDLVRFELQGGLVLELIVLFYLVVVMYVLIEEYYVPALEMASTHLRVPKPLIGCTLMAAGNCLPELSISMVAFVFGSGADLGTGAARARRALALAVAVAFRAPG
eukprot:1341723-Prymnesium_polylepis.1